MAKITFHGDTINTVGDLPTIGTLASDFNLVKSGWNHDWGMSIFGSVSIGIKGMP